MIIQHNIMAMNSYRQLGINNTALGKNLEKLSSGYRINRAGDDAAGLAISEKMRSQIKGLEVAQKNALDGISLVQTAEGALTEVHSMLNRMVELSTQASNGTYTTSDREKLQDEVSALKDEIDRISKATNFNGINLLDGSLSGGKITANGTSLTGAQVAKFSKAFVEGTALGSKDLSSLDDSIKDYMLIDGQNLELDWSQGELKEAAVMLAKDFATTPATKEEMESIANKLTSAINSAILEQGLNGSVKVTVDGANGKFKIESTNKGSTSQIGWTGSDTPQGDVTDIEAANSFGFTLFSKNAGTDETANVANAGQVYNGDTLKAGDVFLMNINGTEVSVTLTAATAFVKGDETTSQMSTAATALEGYIQLAVDAYNTTNKLVAGTFDKTSGLTGLTKADFTVEAGKDGGFVVKYSGNVEGVNFSFSDVGEREIASALGLSSSSSSPNGQRGLQLQVGDTAHSYQNVVVSIGNMSTLGLGIQGINIATQQGAKDAMGLINTAIEKVSTNRGSLGAVQNRLEHTIANLGVTTENLTAAESRIRDTDMAKEMMAFTKNNVLAQAAQSMLAQANQQPQSILQLLR